MKWEFRIMKRSGIGREPWSSGYGKKLTSKVVGSNPGNVYWMDIFSHIFFYKNCNDVCLERPKINEKEAGVGQFLKK